MALRTGDDIVVRENTNWWPKSFVDEAMPQGRKTPTGWLDLGPDGYFMSAGDTSSFPVVQVAEGQVYEFVSAIIHPSATVTILGDGSWRIDRQDLPTSRIWVWNRDTDIGGDGPEEFVRFTIDAVGLAEAVGEYQIHITTWSDSVHAVLIVEDGAARFIVA